VLGEHVELVDVRREIVPGGATHATTDASDAASAALMLACRAAWLTLEVSRSARRCGSRLGDAEQARVQPGEESAPSTSASRSAGCPTSSGLTVRKSSSTAPASRTSRSRRPLRVAAAVAARPQCADNCQRPHVVPAPSETALTRSRAAQRPHPSSARARRLERRMCRVEVAASGDDDDLRRGRESESGASRVGVGRIE